MASRAVLSLISCRFKLPIAMFLSPMPYSHHLSTTMTRYPLQYDLVVYRPCQSATAGNRRWLPPRSETQVDGSMDSEANVESTRKGLNARKTSSSEVENVTMDKKKRKYYNKRRKYMYGSDSSDDEGRSHDSFIELKPEVLEFHSLHKLEEELYFYDVFSYPWEKGKHYKMVYQLEKKYFPDQCLDKAFLESGENNTVENIGANVKRKIGRGLDTNTNTSNSEDDPRFVFFEKEKQDKETETKKDVKVDLSAKKVEGFLKFLKKTPDKHSEMQYGDPCIITRRSELPPTWDAPNGTIVLVNKPKGWTSFTVCGKFRRLVKVKKVGHCGTLDPMATGLLIVCIGKATKLMESFQEMIKGYSGVFRLGEATSTWDADSPVIQRELWEYIKDEDIKKAAASFCGEIFQVPPMFSAIKVAGEKMYEKARKGEHIELAARRISIYQFDIERSLADRQDLIFRVKCSKGTYIRSLCADLGKALGSCAHLTSLRRDSIGEFCADDAWEFDELESTITKSYL